MANAFIGKKSAPTAAELADALGAVQPVWDQLLADLEARHGVDGREWYSYSVKAGWSLRVKRGKRTVVWLVPGSGSFEASFALGEKALEAARTSALSARVRRLLDEAPRYAEGAGVRVPVKSARDCAAVLKLAAAKLSSG